MQMLQDSGSSYFAKIDSDVKSMSLHHAAEGVLATPGKLKQIGQLLIQKAAEILNLFIRNYHEMPASIRIPVQQGKACAGPRNHVVSLVIAGLSDLRKQAIGLHRLGGEDVLDAPGRMQRFHYKTVPRAVAKVKMVQARPLNTMKRCLQ